MSNFNTFSPELETPILDQLHQFFRIYTQSFEMRTHPFGVRPGYFRVLRTLAHADGLSQKALCAQLDITQPTLSSTLRRMERDGLVELRQHTADKRMVHIFLSPEARKRLPEIEKALTDLHAVLNQGLTIVDIRYFTRILAQMTDRLEQDLMDPFLLLTEEVDD